MEKTNNKKLKSLLKFASASIIENEDGTYQMSPRDTNSIYLTILSLNKNNIFDCSNIGYINQQEKFFSFKTSMFNDFIEKYKTNGFKFTDNIKQGQAGNISLSYFSYSHNKKLLNQDMFNIINKTEINIILTKDDNFYVESIKNLDDWNNFINNIINKYKPIRLVLKNVSGYECNSFYLKTINAHFNKVYSDVVDDFIKSFDLKEMKSKELREKYNFELKNYISNVSNNNYQVKIVKGKVEKIYLIEKSYLFLPYEIDNVQNFDKYSFIKNEFNLIKDNDIFEKVDVLKLYSLTNSNKTIDYLTFFMRSEINNIHNRIDRAIKYSKDVLLNNKDSEYIKKITNLETKIFDIVKNNNRPIARIKSKLESKIEVVLFDRKYNKIDNRENQVSWFNVINEGLSFEREKTLSVFFIENIVDKLLNDNHSNIRIELEKPVKKFDGRSGFLDLFITSKKDGEIYGQVFEFKAIYNYSTSVQETCQEQADNYDITRNIIDKYNIKKSYYNYNNNIVELLNLI